MDQKHCFVLLANGSTFDGKKYINEAALRIQNGTDGGTSWWERSTQIKLNFVPSRESFPEIKSSRSVWTCVRFVASLKRRSQELHDRCVSMLHGVGNACGDRIVIDKP
jgi:hypothetical protein